MSILAFRQNAVCERFFTLGCIRSWHEALHRVWHDLFGREKFYGIYTFLLASMDGLSQTPLTSTGEGPNIMAMLSTQDVCERLKVSRYTLYKYVKAGKIKAVSLPRGDYRFEESDYEAFVKGLNDANAVPPVSERSENA